MDGKSLEDTRSIHYVNSKSSDQVLREDTYACAIFTLVLDGLSMMQEYGLAESYKKLHSDTIKQGPTPLGTSAMRKGG